MTRDDTTRDDITDGGMDRVIAQALHAPVTSAHIGAALAAIDRPPASAWSTGRLWLAGAGASALSFTAGVLTSLSAEPGAETAGAIIALAFGQVDIGGLL